MAEKRVCSILDYFRNRPKSGFTANLALQVRFVRAYLESEKLNVEYSLQVSPDLCNFRGHLHQGFITLLVDNLSHYTVWSYDDQPKAMASTNITMNFCKTAERGEVISIYTKCDLIEDNIALVSAEVYMKNKLIALGRHVMFRLKRPMAFN